MFFVDFLKLLDEVVLRFCQDKFCKLFLIEVALFALFLKVWIDNLSLPTASKGFAVPYLFLHRKSEIKL